ncbi:MAG: SemiSWEET family sugar transporter [Gammaproteobacteria bacterium]|nr:SemiSWEET family sugar transporter [Gammaproteobacteria bacterium]
MEGATLFGLIAGTLTTVAFVPQVVKIWKTKSTDDISLGTFFIFSLGVFFWLVYGLMIGALPVILANAATLVLAVAIIILKLRYR